MARDADQRCAVHLRVCQTGDEVRGARTRSRQAHAAFPGHARIPLGGVDRALLVAGQDMPDPVLVIEKGVVDGHDRAAGITKDCPHIFGKQRQNDAFRTIDYSRRCGRNLLILNQCLHFPLS